MSPLLTHLRNAAKACTSGYEVSLSIKEIREIVGMIDGRWQPIETARQSDLETMLLYEDGHIASGRFLAHAHRPGWYMGGNSPDVDYPCPDRPTHWMPTPEPPSPLSSPEEIAQFIGAMQTAPLAITPPRKEDL